MHLLEDCEDFHTILSDALMEIGTKAIDNIFSKVNLHFYYSIFFFEIEYRGPGLWVESLLYVVGFHFTIILLFHSLLSLQSRILKSLQPQSLLVWGDYWASC